MGTGAKENPYNTGTHPLYLSHEEGHTEDLDCFDLFDCAKQFAWNVIIAIDRKHLIKICFNFIIFKFAQQRIHVLPNPCYYPPV